MTDNFYNNLGGDYETMTASLKRASADRKFFEEILHKFPMSKVVDIGCGTGQHIRLLNELGLNVTGIDPSAGLLSIAKKNLSAETGDFSLNEGTMAEVDKIADGPVDAVFCLGNTLPHILTETELQKSFASAYNLLGKDGILVVQVVNYDKVLENRDRILNIKREEGKLFVRFYDFTESGLVFNILVVDEEGGGINHELHSTSLFPWRQNEILPAIDAAGFSSVRIFGGLNFSSFERKNSPNLVLIAQK